MTSKRRAGLNLEVFESLKERGVESVKAALDHVAAFNKASFATPTRAQPLYALRETDSGPVSVIRAAAAKWLARRVRRDGCWVKSGTIAAIVGAGAAIAAALLAAAAWLRFF